MSETSVVADGHVRDGQLLLRESDAAFAERKATMATCAERKARQGIRRDRLSEDAVPCCVRARLIEFGSTCGDISLRARHCYNRHPLQVLQLPQLLHELHGLPHGSHGTTVS